MILLFLFRLTIALYDIAFSLFVVVVAVFVVVVFTDWFALFPSVCASLCVRLFVSVILCFLITRLILAAMIPTF